MGTLEEQWRPGAVVGEYRLVRRLGAGGMGAVDLGEHLATGALRAIKSIVAPLDAELRQRFQREAEVLARVAGHPHVVRVHSAGVAHARPYLVMDHLDGGDLEQRLRAGPLPAREVALLGIALASGLAHVHARGVLHRDLKPSNVLFDEQARPVLVDFGLARPSGARSLTVTGEALGTPAFMAPEQALGDKDAIGPRTDVYGLGALLYAALTGRPPADGKSALDVMTRVLEQAPPAPSSLVSGVPPRLEQVLLRALAKRPEQRFATAEEMGAALATALEVGGGSTGRRAVAVVVVVVVVATVALAAGVALWPAPAGVAADGLAPVASAGAGPALEPARDGTLAPSVAVDGRPATIEEVGAPPANAEVLLPAEARGVVMLGPFGVGEALWLHGISRRLPEGAECYRVAVQLFKQVAEAGGEDAGMAWASLGRAFGRGFGVRQSNLQARRCFEAAADRGDLSGLVSLANSFRDGAPDARDLRRSRDLLLKVLDFVPPASVADAADARFSLILIALEDEGLVSLEAAIAHAERVPTELVDATRRDIRATLFERLGRIDEAVRECVLVLDDAGYGGQAAIHRLGLLVAAGRTQEAAAARADLEKRALEQAGCATSFARLLVQEGRPAEAKKVYLRVAETRGEDPLWHRRTAREELFRLCLRDDTPGSPVTLARARELLLLEPDGAILVEAAR